MPQIVVRDLVKSYRIAQRQPGTLGAVKSLFKRNTRAFSHGCVRLAEPRRMAAAVLGSSVNSIASRLADGENKQQRLKRKVPVYVAYFTAWPNSSGKVDYFGDVYGRDKALAKAMAIEAKVRASARGV